MNIKKNEILYDVEMIERCNDEEILVKIARDLKQNLNVRLEACKKITTESKINYLMLATTLTSTLDNYKVALALAPKTTDEEVVNCSMNNIIFATAKMSALHEIIEKAISYMTDVDMLDNFIRYAKRAKVKNKVINLALNRSIWLMENEE